MTVKFKVNEVKAQQEGAFLPELSLGDVLLISGSSYSTGLYLIVKKGMKYFPTQVGTKSYWGESESLTGLQELLNSRIKNGILTIEHFPADKVEIVLTKEVQ